MRYTITQRIGEGNELAFVTVEKSDTWNGFNIFVKPFIAEVSYGCEKVMHRYNAVTLITPYEYEVKIERIKRSLYRWFPDNPRKASMWYTKQCAKFNLGRAAVTIDSKRKTITIHVSSSANIEKTE